MSGQEVDGADLAALEAAKAWLADLRQHCLPDEARHVDVLLATAGATPGLLPAGAVEVDAETFWAADPEARAARLVMDVSRTRTAEGFWYLETPSTSRYFMLPAATE